MNDEKYERAKRRAKKIKSFYSHLITYLVVNLVLLIINLVTSPDKLWFYWVAIFWGIGLLFDAVNVFLRKGRLLGDEWEEKKIQKILDRDEKSDS
jgi:protein-S-isoprenylcysteine O-methyltransferase Ste14